MDRQYKQLYRSQEDRMVAGVCGGIGEYLGIDPTLVRLAVVLLVFIGAFGPVILTYFIMMIVVPEAPLAVYSSQPAESGANASAAAMTDPGQEEAEGGPESNPTEE